MPPFRYNYKLEKCDQMATDAMRKDVHHYANHSDQHLRNALRFARGCSGSESKVRQKMIEAEMKKRRIS